VLVFWLIVATSSCCCFWWFGWLYHVLLHFHTITNVALVGVDACHLFQVWRMLCRRPSTLVYALPPFFYFDRCFVVMVVLIDGGFISVLCFESGRCFVIVLYSSSSFVIMIVFFGGCFATISCLRNILGNNVPSSCRFSLACCGFGSLVVVFASGRRGRSSICWPTDRMLLACTSLTSSSLWVAHCLSID
jgi:hypothetical protein